MSGDSTKDCSAIAGILPPLYLMFKFNIIYIYISNNNKFENMLKQKYILFVYLIISKIHLQTQYALMFTFLANYYLKQNTLTNTHTHSSMQTKKSVLD